MFVVLVERNALYPVPNDLTAFGPFSSHLAARGFAFNHLRLTGDHCEVIEVDAPPNNEGHEFH